MEPGLYIPTQQNVIITQKISNAYVEIFLNGEYKKVPIDDVEYQNDKIKLTSLDMINKLNLVSIINNPVSDLFYSYNTNRLIPEPHQYKPLIKFLKSQNNRLLIADEVGLGKTIEAGMIYKELDKREDLNISIIVVPPSLTLKWKNELIVRFDEDFEIFNAKQFNNFLTEYSKYSDCKTFNKKIIITYHTIRNENVIELLESSMISIDMLIMDEAHTFRNKSTSTYEGASSITALSENIIYMTATPVQNSISDLYNILTLLDNDTYLDEEYFLDLIKPNQLIHKIVAKLKNNYSLEDIQEFIKDVNLIDLKFSARQTNLVEEFLKINNINNDQKIDFITRFSESDNLSNIINRTKKKDVGMFIPRKATSKTIEPTKIESKFYNEVIEFVKMLFKFRNPETPTGFITVMPERMASSSMLASLHSFEQMLKTKKIITKDIDDNDYEDNSIEMNNIMTEQLSNLIKIGKEIGETDSKYKEFKQIVEDLRKQNIKKIIVFSFFKKTLQYLLEKLREINYRVEKIDGDLIPEERFNRINDFKNDKFDILLSSEVGSEGLDMQFCNVVINYDLPWNPMRVEQRIGRIDRIGQKADRLLIFNLCVEGTIEARIISRLYNRLDIFENTIGELEPILGNLIKTFKIDEIIKLTDSEIEKRVNIETDVITRRKKEINEQNSEIESMMNDEYGYKEELAKFTNNNKSDYVSSSCKKLFLDYLHQHKIDYIELKNGKFKTAKEAAIKLFDCLKPLISPKNEISNYNAQKKVLFKMKRLECLNFSFTEQNTEDYNNEFITLSHPLLKMIANSLGDSQTNYTMIKNDLVKGKYAIVFRQNIKALKKLSNLRTILLDDQCSYLEEIDYYLFMSKCSILEQNTTTTDFKRIENQSNQYIIKLLKEEVKVREEEAEIVINQKVNALKKHFEKKRNYIQKMQLKVLHKDIVRMREAEIENLNKQEEEKIQYLENLKKVTSDYQIMNVLEIIGE